MLAALCTSYCIPKNIWAGGIQTTVKANELLFVMTVFVNGFHNDVMTCKFQIG